MNDEESLWASPAVIIQKLRLLGTFQRDIRFKDSCDNMEELQNDLREILRNKIKKVFVSMLSEPAYYKTKKSLARVMAGDNKDGGMITRMKRGDEKFLKLDL